MQSLFIKILHSVARRADISNAGGVSLMALDLELHLVRRPGFSRNLLAIAAAIPPKGGTTNLNQVTFGVSTGRRV